MKDSKIKTKEIKTIVLQLKRRRRIVLLCFALFITGIISLIGWQMISYHINQKNSAKKQAILTKNIKQEEKKLEEQATTIQPWYSYRYIAHALGGLDGKDYLNSIDGFYAAYNKGYRVFEMDLLLTTDNVVIGKHEWGRKLSDPTTKNGSAVNYSTFKNTKIYGKYTPTSLKDMFQAMDRYEDFYIMTDSKGDEITQVKKDFNAIVKTAKDIGKEAYLDRLVIQVYNQKMFYAIKEIYPFKHFVYTTYKQRDAAFYAMVTFCKKNGIEGVTSPQNDINDYRMELLEEEGIYSFTHSVNNSYFAKEYMKLGVYGVYSDFLSPEQINLSFIRAEYPDFIIKFLKETVPAYRNL